MRTGSIEPEDELSLFAPGALIDDFRITRLLGRGGNGDVYLARDIQLGKRVALKVLRSESAVDRERFLSTARALGKITHPHIAPISALGDHQGSPYVAAEYCEGETLRGRMVAHPLGVKESLGIALAIARALKEAHRHEILYGDLKPENVLIAKDGRPRVVDFGLAPGPSAPAYIAPEQWQRREHTAASDVWAIAAMALDSGVLLVVEGSRVVEISGLGSKEIARGFPPNPKALLATERYLLFGYDKGEAGALSRVAGDAGPFRSLARGTSSRVTRMAEGPGSTTAIGYADGTVALFRSRNRSAAARCVLGLRGEPTHGLGNRALCGRRSGVLRADRSLGAVRRLRCPQGQARAGTKSVSSRPARPRRG